MRCLIAGYLMHFMFPAHKHMSNLEEPLRFLGTHLLATYKALVERGEFRNSKGLVKGNSGMIFFKRSSSEQPRDRGRASGRCLCVGPASPGSRPPGRARAGSALAGRLCPAARPGPAPAGDLRLRFSSWP